jgi:ubiquinone/menaquinone biosynthesis C-methylase UbiE
MNRSSTILPENAAAAAFSRQAPVFDGIYQEQPLIQYKRERVRSHVERFLKPGSRILELNAGTGNDALYFASKGHQVHATDISEGMMEVLRSKIPGGVQTRITTEIRSFIELQQLEVRGPYDLIFSNFGGLNCTDKLDQVLNQLSALLNPGGIVTLVIIPPFCLWESLFLFKGEFKTATRRWWAGKKGAPATIEGMDFRCWYYSPSFISKHLDSFKVLRLEGLCTIVPPSYREHFPGRFPKTLDKLKKLEKRLATKWPWRNIGDYFIMTLQKQAGPGSVGQEG